MEIVRPIKSLVKIKKIQSILKKENMRNYILFNLGIYSGLRISDVLKFKVKDLKGEEYFYLTKGNREIKTGKSKKLKIPEEFYNELQEYLKNKEDEEYIFKSKKGNHPIDRFQAYRILNDVARKVGIKSEIGTHTLRKTFGYHFYQQTKDIAMLQLIFNHRSQLDTLRYIDIIQEEIDDKMMSFSYAIK